MPDGTMIPMVEIGSQPDADAERRVLVDDAASSSEEEQPKVYHWLRGAVAAAALLGTAGVAKVGAGLVAARPSPAEAIQLPPNSATVSLAQKEADAPLTYPAQVSALRKNGYVMIKGRACKIAEISTSKAGKHGHAKVHLVGLDIFTGTKYEDLIPTRHNADVPKVVRKDYHLVDIADGVASLMDDEGETKDDLKVPSGSVGKEIQEKFDEGEHFLVTVLSAMKEEKIVGTTALTD